MDVAAEPTLSGADAPRVEALEQRMATLLAFQPGALDEQQEVGDPTRPVSARVGILERRMRRLEQALFGWPTHMAEVRPSQFNDATLDQQSYRLRLLGAYMLARSWDSKSLSQLQFATRQDALAARARVERMWEPPAADSASSSSSASASAANPSMSASASTPKSSMSASTSTANRATWRPQSGEPLPIALLYQNTPSEPASLLAALRRETQRAIVWVGNDTTLLQRGQTTLVATEPDTARVPSTSQMRALLDQVRAATGRDATLLLGRKQQRSSDEPLLVWPGAREFADRLVEYQITFDHTFARWTPDTLTQLYAALL